MKDSQQLRVTARYSDGREADVTAHAKFQSNNDGLATVDADGLVTAREVPGEVAIMAAYMGSVDVFRAIVPRPGRWRPTRGIGRPAIRSTRRCSVELRQLNIEPSGICTDAEYLRRVYLDVIGTLPTADEARRFLADRRPDRRARLVDELLARPEYADFWALQWSDLLRVDREKLGHKRAFAYYRWIRDQVASNTPLDRFARAIVTAEGPLDEVGPANFYKVVPRAGGGCQLAGAGLSRRADRLRRVSPSSLRPLGPGRLLRHAGVLHPAWRQAESVGRSDPGGG